MIPIHILAIEDDCDRDFLITVYVELYPLMKAIAYQIVNDNHITEDIIHDSLIKLIAKLDTLRTLQRNSLVSYVCRTVRNTAINYYNKHMGDNEIHFYGLDEDAPDIPTDYEKTPEGAFAIKADYEELGQSIRRLPERDRDILYMKYNEQLNDQEISKIMGIKKDSVREYLTRARRKAKQYIAEGGAENE